jgi:hypothetical protein
LSICLEIPKNRVEFSLDPVLRLIVASLISSLLMLPLLLSAADTSTIEGFEAAFRHANASKDFRALEQLVWWDRATPKASKAVRDVLRQEFGHPIRRIETGHFSWAQAIIHRAIQILDLLTTSPFGRSPAEIAREHRSRARFTRSAKKTVDSILSFQISGPL